MAAHWSRLLHVAEGCTDSDTLGTPRLQRVLNRLQDIEKLLGGSAEMFWRAGFPVHAFIKDADADWGESESDFEDELEELYHGLSRYARLSGMTVENLGGQLHDPNKAWEIQVAALACASRIPVRILLGSERGELASTQDETNWLARVDERRRTWAGPMVLRPLLERLIKVGVLPKPAGEGEHGDFDIVWPDIEQLGEKDQAEVSKSKSDALANYVKSGAEAVMPLYYYLVDYQGFDEERAQEIVKEQEARQDEEDEEARRAEEEAAAREEELRAREDAAAAAEGAE